MIKNISKRSLFLVLFDVMATLAAYELSWLVRTGRQWNPYWWLPLWIFIFLLDEKLLNVVFASLSPCSGPMDFVSRSLRKFGKKYL